MLDSIFVIFELLYKVLGVVVFVRELFYIRESSLILHLLYTFSATT